MMTRAAAGSAPRGLWASPQTRRGRRSLGVDAGVALAPPWYSCLRKGQLLRRLGQKAKGQRPPYLSERSTGSPAQRTWRDVSPAQRSRGPEAGSPPDVTCACEDRSLLDTHLRRQKSVVNRRIWSRGKWIEGLFEALCMLHVKFSSRKCGHSKYQLPLNASHVVLHTYIHTYLTVQHLYVVPQRIPWFQHRQRLS